MLRHLTTERLMLIILFVMVFALATRVPVDTDTWWHLRSAEHTLMQGMIYADPFSFSRAGDPWINHSWGAQIIMYGFWRLLENGGLALYTSLLATAGMALVFRMCSGNTYVRAFAVIMGAATAAIFWSARPQMMSFFFSTLLLYLLFLVKYRRHDYLWFIPLMLLVWGNMHAGFSIGFILLGGFIAGEILNNLFRAGAADVVPWRTLGKLMLIGVISAVALVVNPYGFAMLGVPFETINIGTLGDFIQEWLPPDFHERNVLPFVALLLGTFGVLGASSKRLDWTDFVLFCGTALMAFLAARNIAVFAVVAVPVFTRHLDVLLTERGWVLTPIKVAKPGMARLNLALLLLIVLGATASIFSTLSPQNIAAEQGERLPVAAVQYLREHPHAGNLFNSYNWGGYLMFALPDTPVFVDGRTDLYRDEFLTRYLLTTTARGDWRGVLDQYAIGCVFVEAGSGLAAALRSEPGWQLAYEDEAAVIFVRTL